MKIFLRSVSALLLLVILLGAVTVIAADTQKVTKDVYRYPGAIELDEEGIYSDFADALKGTGKETGKRHPTIGNNVLIGTGAKVLGPFKVGDNSRIAANSVVLGEIPPVSTAVGVPARVVKRKGQRTDFASEVDQVSVTDPVAEELAAIRRALCEMNTRLKNER